jgi:hypothetical protein
MRVRSIRIPALGNLSDTISRADNVRLPEAKQTCASEIDPGMTILFRLPHYKTSVAIEDILNIGRQVRTPVSGDFLEVSNRSASSSRLCKKIELLSSPGSLIG